MNENIKAGSDIHAGDGGYSEGTKEKYDEFVKIRNKSLAKARINLLAEQAGLKVNDDGEISAAFFGSVDAGYKKFAELLIKECIKSLWTEECHTSDLAVEEYNRNSKKIKQHFGIEK